MQVREKDTDDKNTALDQEIDRDIARIDVQSSIYGCASGADSNGDERAKLNPYLPVNLQKNAEKALGIGLSNVNIYKNSTDAQTIGAQAFTRGNSIHFAPGMFNPYSIEGQELIAHELVHIAQQNPANSDGTKNDLGAAEIQADALIERVLSGNSIHETLEKVSFNSIQLKPDFTLPPDYSSLELYYFVFVTHDCSRNQFAEIIAKQVYRNENVKVDLIEGQESFTKGSIRSVSVSLDSFLQNLLFEDRQADEKPFEARKQLLERYLLEKWLLPLGNNKYKLNYGKGSLDQGSIEKNQDQLIVELRHILKNGWSQSVNELSIPSYNRSHFNSANPNGDKEATHFDSFTTRERSKAIEDHVFRYMPFEDQKDYIEFIYHAIPNSDQFAGISYQYFYFDPNTEKYLNSQVIDLPLFDPYEKISSAPIFKFKENTISISYQTTKISNDKSTSDITETFSVVKEDGKVRITNGNLFTDSFTINSKELLRDVESYTFNAPIVPFRSKALVEDRQNGGVLLERKRREKKLYENLRHRNAVSHLQEIQDYYGDESNFLKVREDFNRFFTKTNLSVINVLSPSDQFTFLYLLEQLSATDDLTIDKLKNVITGFKNFFNIEIKGFEDVSSVEQLTLALTERKSEIARDAEEQDKVRQEVFEKYRNHSTDAELNEILVPQSLPFEINNELALINALTAFINAPSTKREYLKSILNNQLREKLLFAEFNSNSSNVELELMSKTMREKDDVQKIKYLKELLKSVLQLKTTEPWVKVLSEAKDINQFKEGVGTIPDETIQQFFKKILDGSLLESVVSEQKNTVDILKSLGQTKAIQAPLQRMNDEVENFIKNEGLDEINLKRIDAVFYPGQEGMYEEANFVEPIPLNLYYYTKNEVRYIVLFIDNGKEVSSKSLEAPGKEEILTHGLLKYIDQQKILGQGIMYYIDSKKYDGESSYTPGTVSSYEFIMENSWPQTIANYTSGVVMLLSIFGGPLGLLRNAAFSMTTTGFALASLVAVAADTWNKSEYEDLEILDYTDLIVGAGTLGFDIVKSLKLAKLLSKVDAQNPQFVEAVMNSIDKIESKQEYWDLVDVGNNIAGLIKPLGSGDIGVGDYYTIAQVLFALAGYSKKGLNKLQNNNEPDLLKKVQNRKFNIGTSFENSIALNEGIQSVNYGNSEFYQVIGLFSEIQVQNIKMNLIDMPEHTRKAFIQNFGKGDKNTKVGHYVLLQNMSTGKVMDIELKVKEAYGNLATPLKKIDPKQSVDLRKVNESGKNVRDANEKQTGLIDEYEKLEASIKLQTERITQFKAEIDELKVKVVQAQETFDTADIEFKLKQKSVQDLQLNVGNYKRSIDQTNKKKRTADYDVTNLEAKLKNISVELESLKSKAQPLQELLSTRETISKLKEKIAQFDKNLENDKRKGKKKGLTGEEGMQKSKWGKELARLKIEQKRIEKNKMYKKQSNDDLNKSISEIKTQLDNNTLDYNQKSKEVADLKKSLETMNTNLVKLNEELKNSIDELNVEKGLEIQLKTKLGTAEKNVLDLKESLGNKEIARDDATKDRDGALKTLSDKDLQIGLLKTEKFKLERQHELELEAHEDAFNKVVLLQPKIKGPERWLSVLNTLEGYQFKRVWELGKQLFGSQEQLESDEEYTKAISGVQTTIKSEISRIARNKISLLMKLREAFLETLKNEILDAGTTLNSLQKGNLTAAAKESMADLQIQLEIGKKWQEEITTMEYSLFENWIETNVSTEGTEGRMKSLLISFHKKNHFNFDNLKYYSILTELLVDIYGFTAANYGNAVQE